jgi:hypothetical protein
MHRLVLDFILRNYAAGHTDGAFPGVGMFVDISGFSAMTDALMQHGQQRRRSAGHGHARRFRATDSRRV